MLIQAIIRRKQAFLLLLLFFLWCLNYAKCIAFYIKFSKTLAMVTRYPPRFNCRLHPHWFNLNDHTYLILLCVNHNFFMCCTEYRVSKYFVQTSAWIWRFTWMIALVYLISITYQKILKLRNSRNKSQLLINEMTYRH